MTHKFCGFFGSQSSRVFARESDDEFVEYH